MLSRYCCIGLFGLVLFFKLHETALIPSEGDGDAFVSTEKRDVKLQLKSSGTEPQWGYTQIGSHVLGPEQWHTAFPSCGGLRQSPVAIQSSSMQTSSFLKPLKLVDYDDTAINGTWALLNNGHSAQLTASFHTPPQLQGGDLPGKYAFQQIHLHWGSNDLIGSEHTLNGRWYPLEMHLVHQKKNLPGNEAANHSDGLAVLGVVFEVSKEPNSNQHIDHLIDALGKIIDPEAATTVQLPALSLEDFVPQNRSYIRYLGSLTTPPCSEAVVWTVMSTPLRVRPEQLNALRVLLSTKEATAFKTLKSNIAINNNFRPLQPLNNRLVHYFHDNGTLSGSCS